MARSPIRYDYANRRLVYLRETSSCWIIAVHVSLSICCRNSYSPSATRPVPTTSISAEKEPSACDRDHCPYSIGGGTRLPGSSAIDHTYPVSNISLRVCWIESSRNRSGSAYDITSQTTPVRTLTPGTIKENRMLTCGVCNDPVHTTINSITIDTTNLRTVWTVTLNNQSGAQQTDYFAQFSLQDPLGNTYEGTGRSQYRFLFECRTNGVQNRDLLVSAASGCLLHTRCTLWRFRHNL